MTLILIAMIVYVVASAWDVRHINGLMEDMINPGRPKPEPTVTPAPRLVIPGQVGTTKVR